jgi:hypothetical protein
MENQHAHYKDSRSVIPSYRWICPVCDSPNAPAGACSRCVAPARLSASEMQLAKTKGVAALYAHRQDAQRARANWMARPLWRKIGDVIFGTMFVVGIFLVRLAWVFAGSLRYPAVGCVALLLSVLWFVATRGRIDSG